MIFIKIRFSRFFIILFSCFLLAGYSAEAQIKSSSYQTEKQWVDSVYNALTQQQRIGQLFMLRANSEVDSSEIRILSRLVKDYNIGGLCFF